MDVYDLDDLESRRAAKVDAGNIHNGTDVLGYRVSGHSRQPSSAACRSLLDKLDDLVRRSRREARAVMRGASTSNDFRYHQSMVKLHNLIWGWSQAFRHSTAMHVFVQLDKEIDKRIEEIDSQVRRLVSVGKSVIRRRIMGIHVLADTPAHPLPDVIISAADSSSIRDQDLAA
jgi:RNA-directed DNA polymerase